MLKAKAVSKLKSISIYEVLFLLYFCLIYGHTFDTAELAVSLALILTASVCFINDMLKKRLDYKQYGFFAWYLLFYFYCRLSAFWALDYHLAVNAVTSMLTNICVLLAAVCYVNTRERFWRLIKIHLLAFCYMCFRVIFLLPELRFFGRGFYVMHVTPSTGIHYNGAGIFLAGAVLLTVLLWLTTKKYSVLLLVLFFYLMNVIGGSRQGMLSPAAGIFIIVALMNGIRHIYRTILVSFAGLASGLLFLFSGLPGSSVMLSLMKGIFGSAADGNFNERAEIAGMALSMCAERPLFGHGLGMVMYHSHKALDTFFTSHNNGIELFASLGIIGLLIYYTMYGRILWDAFKRFRNRNVYAVFSIAMCSVLLFVGMIEVTFYGYCASTCVLFLFYAYYAMKLATNNEDVLPTCQKQGKKVSQDAGS
jgi:O-antigen ligase